MNDETVLIKQATKQGFIECRVLLTFLTLRAKRKTRRGRVQESGEICPTITASNIGICLIEKLE